jgi:hypothetical protein
MPAASARPARSTASPWWPSNDATFGSGGVALVASDDDAEFDNVRVTTAT